MEALFWRPWEFQSRLTIIADNHVLLWRNNNTSGQYDTAFYNDPVRRTTSACSVARRNVKWSRYCICRFIFAANWGKVVVTPIWYRSTLAQPAEHRRYAGAWFGNHRVREFWGGLKQHTVKTNNFTIAKWPFSAVNLSCNCVISDCIKHRRIAVSTVKWSLFIPPGQFCCAKDTSVGKVAECKLNELGSILIPWRVLDCHAPFYPVGNGGIVHSGQCQPIPSAFSTVCSAVEMQSVELSVLERCIYLTTLSVANVIQRL